MKIGKRYITVFTCTIVFLVSCAPKFSSSFIKEGYSGTTFNKIAVVGITKNISSRLSFERAAVNLLKENGINAIQGISIFPQGMTEEAQKPENIVQIIKDNQLDGVITMSLVGEKESQKYQPGDMRTVPVGYYRVGRYMYRRYATIREPGFYTQEKSYIIEAVMYSLKGNLNEGKDNWIWTGQTSLVEPSSIESAAATFSKRLVNQLLKDKVVLPTN